MNIGNNESLLEHSVLEDYMESMRLKMASRISLFFIGVFTILSVTFMNDDFSSLVGYLSALAISTMVLIYILISKKSRPIFAIYGVGGSIIALGSCSFIPEATHYVDFIWLIVCTFVVYIGGLKRLGFGLLCFNALGVGYFLYFRHNIHISTIDISSNLQLTGAYLEILLSLFVLAYLLYQFNHFQEYKDNHINRINQSLYDQNQVIEKQYTENVTLLKEIHHRVKNNLQIIVSLLRLQKNELATDESKGQFQEAINRVLVMSSIHQKLYQQESLIHINLTEYLEDLISELKILFNNHQKIEIRTSVALDEVDLKSMIPIGLIINELLSNSLKYAFTNKQHGQIDVELFPTEKGFNINYSDNGIWQKETEKSGFGLELIAVFTNQLNGKYIFNTNEQGSTYNFELEFAQ